MGGVAWVDPEVTRSALAASVGKQATGVPKLQGKAGVEWDVPALPGLTLTGNATSVSKQYISADNKLAAAGRTTFDVGARYGAVVGGRRVTLRGTVSNIANKAYWGMPLLSSLALGAPRTLQMSVTVDLLKRAVRPWLRVGLATQAELARWRGARPGPVQARNACATPLLHVGQQPCPSFFLKKYIARFLYRIGYLNIHNSGATLTLTA